MSEFKAGVIRQGLGSKWVDYDILALNLWEQWNNDLQAALISKLLILMNILVLLVLHFRRQYFLEQVTNL